jgi:predicted AAA+ superfamily ATPase
MLLEERIKEIAQIQEKDFLSQEDGVRRDLLDEIDVNVPHAVIISGIRRCGKSTLLKQLMHKAGECNFFNFEDNRAGGFDLNDFEKLDRVFDELHPGMDCYYFDEIQVVPEWERFARGKLDRGKKFVITGSNASLLSRELGTKLTGRHLTYELFPFSYPEALRMRGRSPSLSTFNEYVERGGFPEHIISGTQDILQQLFRDIIARDVVVRYGLRNVTVVRNLASYLLSNVGSEFSYSKLAKMFGITTKSIAEYVSYFEDSYMLFTVPMFSYSYRKTVVNPKKIYAIDPGFVKANTVSYTDNNGSLLENIVFLQLRRTHKSDSIFYYKGKRECDFIVVDRSKPVQAIQVCYKLTNDNMLRELNGVTEAMGELKLKNGLIITLDQTDKFGNVEVMPAWKWLVEKNMEDIV